MGLFCLDHGIINGNFLLPYFSSRRIYTVYTVYIYLRLGNKGGSCCGTGGAASFVRLTPTILPSTLPTCTPSPQLFLPALLALNSSYLHSYSSTPTCTPRLFLSVVITKFILLSKPMHIVGLTLR